MKPLLETMRWYGPQDHVSLADIRQAGASGIVTALHEIPNGAVWPLEKIQERKKLIEDSGMQWTVVESVPVHEEIKTRTGDFKLYIRNYQNTIKNLAETGIKTICYNFMPVLDWTRTDLSYCLPDGAKALQFDLAALAAFDLYILNRPNAEKDYSDEILKGARQHFDGLTDIEKEKLKRTIIAGLPGSEEGYTIEDFRNALATYDRIDDDVLAENLALFLEEIIPVAERCEVKMALHPDDPPFSILGLPRVVSSADDVKRILARPASNSNGLTFCTGSFGVRPDNDLVSMVNQFADRIHFVHLRSTRRDEHGNFYEEGHLQGDVPMFDVVASLMKINNETDDEIPMRPDHGHQILDDLNKTSNPGYSAIGRLKGLAELRGLMYALSQIK